MLDEYKFISNTNFEKDSRAENHNIQSSDHSTVSTVSKYSSEEKNIGSTRLRATCIAASAWLSASPSDRVLLASLRHSLLPDNMQTRVQVVAFPLFAIFHHSASASYSDLARVSSSLDAPSSNSARACPSTWAAFRGHVHTTSDSRISLKRPILVTAPL